MLYCRPQPKSTKLHRRCFCWLLNLTHPKYNFILSFLAHTIIHSLSLLSPMNGPTCVNIAGQSRHNLKSHTVFLLNIIIIKLPSYHLLIIKIWKEQFIPSTTSLRFCAYSLVLKESNANLVPHITLIRLNTLTKCSPVNLITPMTLFRHITHT